jgi:hypothetical protein
MTLFENKSLTILGSAATAWYQRSSQAHVIPGHYREQLMANSIKPLRTGDLPDMEKSFWRMTGPGAIMVGLAVGSGELVLWPWIIARFGVVMAWAPLLAVFVQIWINIEIGRWAIATGESALNGVARVSMKIIYLYLGFLFVLTMLPGWGRLTAATVRFLIFGSKGPWAEGSMWGSDWLWTLPITALVWAVLLGPKKIYNGVERTVMILVIVIFVGLIVVAVKIGTVQDVQEMGSGLATFPPQIKLDEDFTFLRFYGGLVFAGGGGFGLLFYSYYLRDKGIGMGARFPMLEIDIRGKQERSEETGYIFPETPENKKRFRNWINYVIYDTTLFFGLASAITLILFMFAALVTLHPQPLGFGDGDLIWDLSDILGRAMGAWGRYLYLVIAIAALFSTILTNTDGGIRMWTDMIHKGFPSTQRWSPGSMYAPLMIGLWPVGFISLWYFETHSVSILDFFFISAAINGIAMSIYMPIILYMNLTTLPKSARPGPVNIFFVTSGTLFYAGGALYMLGDVVGLW